MNKTLDELVAHFEQKLDPLLASFQTPDPETCQTAEEFARCLKLFRDDVRKLADAIDKELNELNLQ